MVECSTATKYTTDLEKGHYGETTNHILSPHDVIHIGNTIIDKEEFLRAFGGNLNTSPHRKFGNASPLGLSAFSLTTFVLSLCNAQTRGISEPNIVVGLALFYGGLVQLLAGMWELASGSTFGGCALSSYGGFWLSYAAIQIDAFGIATAYSETSDLQSAVGFYLTGWFIFTSLLVLCTMKSNLAFFSLFVFLDVTFLLLMLGEFLDSVGCTKAGGIVGIITSFIGFYNAYCGLADDENSYIVGNPIPLPVYRKQKI